MTPMLPCRHPFRYPVLLKINDTGETGFILGFTEECSDQGLVTAGLMKDCTAKPIFFFAQDPAGREGTFHWELGATCEHDSGRFARGVGIDDSNLVRFAHRNSSYSPLPSH